MCYLYMSTSINQLCYISYSLQNVTLYMLLVYYAGGLCVLVA